MIGEVIIQVLANLILFTFLAWASIAQAAPIEVDYTKTIATSDHPQFENSLNDAYQFVAKRIGDHSDRSRCPIHVVFSDLGIRVGYVANQQSPCHDVVEIDRSLEGDVGQAPVVLVHELVHLIRHQVNSHEIAWLDEGLARELESEYLQIWPTDSVALVSRRNQFSMSQDLNDFDLTKSGKTNLGQHKQSDKVLLNYASAFLFVRYLTEHIGGSTFLRAVVQSQKSGWDAIEEVAPLVTAREHIGIDKDHLNRRDLWVHFAFALALNDSAIADVGLFKIDNRFEVMHAIAKPTLFIPPPPGSITFYKKSDFKVWREFDQKKSRIYGFKRTDSEDLILKRINSRADLLSLDNKYEFVAVGLPQ